MLMKNLVVNESETVSINSINKTVKYKMDYHISPLFVLVTICLLLINIDVNCY